MNLNRELTKLELHDLGFTPAKDQLPRMGAPLLCYHKTYGLTLGYYAGIDCGFLLPFVTGYNWATYWRHHS